MSQKFETLALHAGYDREKGDGTCAVPLSRTSAYHFRDAKHARDLFHLKELGNIYTRLNNPTQDVLEQRVAALEGGVAAVALSSGTSAIFYAIINLAKAGDEIVATSNLYGGTYTMFNNILPDLGIKVHIIENGDYEGLKSAINEKTRAVYTETIGNPSLNFVDIKKYADIAHGYEVPLIVDSTFTTPYLYRPIEDGADIVVHSLTKWMGGHGIGIGGIVIDSGNFDWTIPKFALFNEPEASYQNLRFAHDLGDLNKMAYALRLRLVPLRNLGAAISPDNAWQFLQGIETLALRMERHSENALKVAKYLQAHKDVEWVNYPGLEGDESYELAKEKLPNGAGGMVVFEVKGGKDAGEKFINSLELFSHVANVGDAKSLAVHPSSTTHSQLSEEAQKKGRITPGLIRLSIGIENIDDIIQDLDRALKA
ncbi:O-acetylhomoserine aminocarboxypropyltransferase/cysteine synthase [Thiospirochaeta perfilievii]|uniref:O-succinylhomoserine sulfhydrylase n=1 Tax=Thiospirochaeta perfilievii TaxID=252967 RepID=A0A5C1QAV4_9SPIO|nr:O-acetylhomoserine aminocarboxypropyltransferase/cysteine synthase family protein [Thiospirochaeta perfilievii]QEN05253.1 O-acetylhomoserine aminocarboxypropyltransferase/cysteine synthase [Thiospirochaeta perfilievii]